VKKIKRTQYASVRKERDCKNGIKNEKNMKNMFKNVALIFWIGFRLVKPMSGF